MNKTVKHALWGVLVAGGITLLGATSATAAETDGDDGILSGTQVIAPISAPVKIVGNALSILGTSSSAGTPTAAATPAEVTPAPEASTSGDGGVASGSQAAVSVNLPITIADNAVGVLGSAGSTPAEPAPEMAPAPAPSVETSGLDGVLAGTQALIDVQVPVTITGNSLAVLGSSDASASPAPNAEGADTSSDAPTSAPSMTGGDDSLLGGTQIALPSSVPVTVGGNAISVLGDSTATGTDGNAAPVTPAMPAEGPTTSGQDSLLGGTQIALPISIPITVGGNALSVLGDSVVTDAAPADPGSDPGTEPGTDPGTGPADAETDADAEPGAALTPTVTAVPAMASAVASGDPMAAAAMLARTGSTPDAAAMSLAGLLLAAGAVLTVRRRRA